MFQFRRIATLIKCNFFSFGGLTAEEIPRSKSFDISHAGVFDRGKDRKYTFRYIITDFDLFEWCWRVGDGTYHFETCDSI